MNHAPDQDADSRLLSELDVRDILRLTTDLVMEIAAEECPGVEMEVCFPYAALRSGTSVFECTYMTEHYCGPTLRLAKYSSGCMVSFVCRADTPPEVFDRTLSTRLASACKHTFNSYLHLISIGEFKDQLRATATAILRKWTAAFSAPGHRIYHGDLNRTMSTMSIFNSMLHRRAASTTVISSQPDRTRLEMGCMRTTIHIGRTSIGVEEVDPRFENVKLSLDAPLDDFVVLAEALEDNPFFNPGNATSIGG